MYWKKHSRNTCWPKKQTRAQVWITQWEHDLVCCMGSSLHFGWTIIYPVYFSVIDLGAFHAFDKDGDGIIKLNVLEVNCFMLVFLTRHPSTTLLIPSTVSHIQVGLIFNSFSSLVAAAHHVRLTSRRALTKDLLQIAVLSNELHPSPITNEHFARFLLCSPKIKRAWKNEDTATLQQAKQCLLPVPTAVVSPGHLHSTMRINLLMTVFRFSCMLRHSIHLNSVYIDSWKHRLYSQYRSGKTGSGSELCKSKVSPTTL